jgi:hypothetical protein
VIGLIDVPYRDIDCPLHMDASGRATIEGKDSIVTLTLSVVVPQVLVEDAIYAVVVVGDTITLAPLIPPGFHTMGCVEVAVRLSGIPLHREVSALAVNTGLDNTVTKTLSDFVPQIVDIEPIYKVVLVGYTAILFPVIGPGVHVIGEVLVTAESNTGNPLHTEVSVLATIVGAGLTVTMTVSLFTPQLLDAVAT